MLTVYGEVAAGPPQMEEQPVALEMIHAVAEELGDQTRVAGLGAAGAGAGELKQRLLELAALDRVGSDGLGLLGDLGDAVVEDVLLGQLALGRDHGERCPVGQALTQTAQPMQSSGETARVNLHALDLGALGVQACAGSQARQRPPRR